jgi:hypothetical protein
MSKEQNDKKIDLSQKVMAQIKSQHIKMHSKLYFVFGSVLVGSGLAGALITAMFFLAVVSFRLRVYGSLEYLRFGQLGLRPFFMTFPWIPLLVGVVGIVGGIMLLRKYEFSYKRSFISVAIVLVTLVLVFGFLLDQVAFDERFRQDTIGRLLHQRSQLAGDNWVIGEIIAINENEMTILEPDNKEVRAIWDEDTMLPFGGDFKVGQRIRLIGEWQDDVFVAEGISKGKMQWRGMRHNGSQIKGKMTPPAYRHRFSL